MADGYGSWLMRQHPSTIDHRHQPSTIAISHQPSAIDAAR
jgi:hypothetical protein